MKLLAHNDSHIVVHWNVLWWFENLANHLYVLVARKIRITWYCRVCMNVCSNGCIFQMHLIPIFTVAWGMQEKHCFSPDSTRFERLLCDFVTMTELFWFNLVICKISASFGYVLSINVISFYDRSSSSRKILPNNCKSGRYPRLESSATLTDSNPTGVPTLRRAHVPRSLVVAQSDSKLFVSQQNK